jgi:hypothetical protein
VSAAHGEDEGGLQRSLSVEVDDFLKGMVALDASPFEESPPPACAQRSMEDRELKRLARMASLDPNDGIAL